MDVQLKELIEKIKSQGIESANKESAQIIEAAEKDAAAIVQKAGEEAASLLKKANETVEKNEAAGREALKQAARDLMLGLEKRITDIFKEIISREAEKHLSGKVLEDAIVTLIQSWKEDSVGDIEVFLAPERFSELKDHLFQRLAAELKSGLQIKPFPQIDAGFRISLKDGTAYHDFSVSGIADVLSGYLTPGLAELVSKASKGN